MIRITPVKIAKIDLLGIYVLQYSAEFGGPSFFSFAQKEIEDPEIQVLYHKAKFCGGIPLHSHTC